MKGTSKLDIEGDVMFAKSSNLQETGNWCIYIYLDRVSHIICPSILNKVDTGDATYIHYTILDLDLYLDKGQYQR